MVNFYLLTPSPLNCIPRALSRGVISLTLLIIFFFLCLQRAISICYHQLPNDTISNKKLPLALLNNKGETDFLTYIEAKKIQNLDGAILQVKLRKKVEENYLRKERNYDKINDNSVSPSIHPICLLNN